MTANSQQEEARLKALFSLKLLDTVAEERFDRITGMAVNMFGVKTALVSLVDRDRLFFKSKQGSNTDNGIRLPKIIRTAFMPANR